MISNIISTLKDTLVDNFKNKTELTGAQAEKAAALADDSIKEGLKSEAVSNPSGLLDIFTGRSGINSSNPVVENITAKYISDLISKAGIPATIANSAAKFAVPFVLERISGKYRADSGSTDQRGMLDFLGIGGINNIINKDVTDSGEKILKNFKKLF